MLHYMLNPDHSISSTEDVIEWGRWFEGDPQKRVVAQDNIGNKRVSTVFLGIDHGFADDKDNPPILFETMVFNERHDSEEVDRYATWDEAVEGHRRMCATLTSGLSREQLEAAKAILEPLLK